MTDLDARGHHTVTELKTCLPWLRTTFKFLLFSRRKVKIHYVFLQKFPYKIDQKYCHTLKGQEKMVNKS